MAADTIARFTAHVIDDEGKKGTIVAHLYIDGTQTIAAAKTALTAYLNAVYACTDAEISEGSITVLTGDLSGTYPVTAGSDLEETGNLNFSVATVPYHWGETILAFKDSLLSGNQIDTSAGAITTLTGLLTGAVLGGTYTDRGARSLTALAYSFQGDRKHRRKLHQISYKVGS
jgi:hypothetical protein